MNSVYEKDFVIGKLFVPFKVTVNTIVPTLLQQFINDDTETDDLSIVVLRL